MTTNRVDTTLPEHSWIPFYEELAHKLLNEGWRNRQPELVQMLKEMKKGDVVPLPEVIDTLDNHIDPFSFYGTITRKLTEKNTKRAMISFKSKFDLKSNRPTRKPFIPYIRSIKMLYFDTQLDSYKENISTLWDVFEFVVKADTFNDGLDSGKLVDLMDAGLSVKEVGISKLSAGFYCVNPHNFLHVDTVNAVGGKDLGIKATDGESYLQCLERTRELVQCPFPNLNIPVWILGNRQEHPKIWVIHAQKGKLTGDFISQGYVIGWEPLKVDMSSIKTRKEKVEIYSELVSQLESFLFEIEPGDYVITPSGKKDFFYCIVRGLFFSSNDQETRREAHWIGGPLPKDTASSIPWNNQRSVFEVGRTDQRNEFFKLIGRNDLIENA